MELTVKIVVEDGVWFGQILEFPGCMTEADSPEELGVMLADAARVWLADVVEDMALDMAEESV